MSTPEYPTCPSRTPPPPPPPSYGIAPAMPTVCGLAIASMVLGIIWIYWIGSILAIIFGHVALAQIRQSNGWKTGRGMAIAGLALGYTGIGLLALGIVVAIIGNASGSGSNY